MQLTPVPFQASLQDYQKQADDLFAGWKARDEDAIRIAVHKHPKFLNPEIPWLPKTLTKEDVLGAPFDASDAQLTIAPTTAVQHPRSFVLHREPDAFHSNVHHPVVVGFSLVNERSYFTFDAGVAKSQIESFVFTNRKLDQRLNIGGEQDVRSPKAGHPTRRADHRNYFFSALNVAITDHDPRTIASKRERRSAADSQTTACHHHTRPLERV